MWQQAGRAGREAQPSLAVLVAGDDQLDQWFMAHPERGVQPAARAGGDQPRQPASCCCPTWRAPPTNCRCGHADERWWPDLLDDGVRELVLDDRLRLRPGPATRPTMPSRCGPARGWPARRRRACGPAPTTSSASPCADGTLVGTVDAQSGLPPGASRRRLPAPGPAPTECVELDLDDQVALVEPSDGSEYTQPRVDTDISLLARATTTRRGRDASSLGLGARAGALAGHRLPAVRRLHRRAAGRRGAPPPATPSSRPGPSGTWSASDVLRDAQAVARGGCPARCTPSSTPPSASCRCSPSATAGTWAACPRHCSTSTGVPTIVIYDGYPGGAGIAELGFAAAGRAPRATLDVVASCPCDGRLPVVRAVAQVRQRQRAPRQGRRDRALAHASRLTTAGHDSPSRAWWRRPSVASPAASRRRERRRSGRDR